VNTRGFPDFTRDFCKFTRESGDFTRDFCKFTRGASRGVHTFNSAVSEPLVKSQKEKSHRFCQFIDGLKGFERWLFIQLAVGIVHVRAN